MSDHTALLNRIRQVSALAPFNQWLNLHVEHAEAGRAQMETELAQTEHGRARLASTQHRSAARPCRHKPVS